MCLANSFCSSLRYSRRSSCTPITVVRAVEGMFKGVGGKGNAEAIYKSVLSLLSTHSASIVRAYEADAKIKSRLVNVVR